MSDHEDAEAKRIGRLIAKLRLKQGWSQQDLAGEIKVSVSSVSRWERGLHESYAENVRKLAKALKVHPSLLRPTEPDIETQLDRIEEKLDRLLKASGIEEPVSPLKEAGLILDEIERELEPGAGADQSDAERPRNGGAGHARPKRPGGSRRAR